MSKVSSSFSGSSIGSSIFKSHPGSEAVSRLLSSCLLSGAGVNGNGEQPQTSSLDGAHRGPRKGNQKSCQEKPAEEWEDVCSLVIGGGQNLLSRLADLQDIPYWVNCIWSVRKKRAVWLLSSVRLPSRGCLEVSLRAGQ